MRRFPRPLSVLLLAAACLSGLAGRATLVLREAGKPDRVFVERDDAAPPPQPSATQPAPAQPATGPVIRADTPHTLGVNVGPPDDYERGYKARDLARFALWPPGTADKPGDGNAVLGTDGKPAGPCGFVLRRRAVPRMSGRYAFVLNAAPAAGQDVTLTVTGATETPLARGGDGLYRCTADATFDAANDQMVAAVRGVDRVGRLRVLAPNLARDPAGRTPYTEAEADASLWSDTYVAHLQSVGYAVLRSQDVARAVLRTDERWADAPTAGQISYNRTGVPWADFLDLCSRAGADPWLCVPPRADDDYVRALALLCRDALPPGRVVYVEPGCELWNTAGSFAVNHDWNVARARAERAAGAAYAADDETAGWQRTARRAAEMGEAFRSVLGRDRVRPVLPLKAAGSVDRDGRAAGSLKAGVEWVEKNRGPAADFFYGAAFALYANPPADQPVGRWPAHWTADLLWGVNAKPRAAYLWSKGLRPVQYECGLDWQQVAADPSDPGATWRRIAALRADPGMAAYVRAYLSRWPSNAGPAGEAPGPVLWYRDESMDAPARQMQWGATSDAAGPDTPTVSALRQFARGG